MTSSIPRRREAAPQTSSQQPKQHGMITRRRRRLISAPVNGDLIQSNSPSPPAEDYPKRLSGPIRRNGLFRLSATNLSRPESNRPLKRGAPSTIIVRRSSGASSPKTYVITTTNPAETTAILRQHGLTSYRICSGSTDSGINGSRKSSANNSKKSSPSDSNRNSPTSNQPQTLHFELQNMQQQSGADHARSPPIESPSTEHSNMFGSDSPGSFREVGKQDQFFETNKFAFKSLTF